MTRYAKIVIIVLVVGIVFIFVAQLYWPWVFFPTDSSPHKLTHTMRRWRDSNKPVVTVRHYIAGIRSTDYIPTLENGISNLEKQQYLLPNIDSGTVEVVIELGDSQDSSFSITYDQASELYERGLLIHLTDNNSRNITVGNIVYYDSYVYFVSGNMNTYYFKEANTSEWLSVNDAPPLSRIHRKERPPADVVYYSGWKENEWRVVNIDNQT